MYKKFIQNTVCWEPLWEIPPMTRSWRKYLTSKAIQDPIHDQVIRKKPDMQGHSGYKGLSRWASASTPPCILLPFLLLFSSALLQILVLPAENSPVPLSLNKDQLKTLINKSPGRWTLWRGQWWRKCFNSNPSAGILVCLINVCSRCKKCSWLF